MNNPGGELAQAKGKRDLSVIDNRILRAGMKFGALRTKSVRN
jgi:hypothetical protein